MDCLLNGLGPSASGEWGFPDRYMKGQSPSILVLASSLFSVFRVEEPQVVVSI